MVVVLNHRFLLMGNSRTPQLHFSTFPATEEFNSFNFRALYLNNIHSLIPKEPPTLRGMTMHRGKRRLYIPLSISCSPLWLAVARPQVLAMEK